MIKIIIDVNQRINEIVWGAPLIGLIIGVGIYLCIGTGFLQFRIRKVINGAFGRRRKIEGDITPLQALSVALGGTVGVGNIAGVATAITFGGPGAIFWMWLSGLVGMATKYSEVVLGINYRVRQLKGPFIGGPMVYIRRGLGKKYNLLALCFAIFGALAAFGVGNMVQANSVAIGFQQLGLKRHVTAFILAIFVGLVTLGGLKRIAKVASVCVPFMCIIYFLSAVVIILLNIQRIPWVLFLVVKSAFTPLAATGGFLGSTIKSAIRWGVARGVFSNEAGLGSASIAHSTAQTDHPVRQGYFGIFEVFVDTLVICSATAIVILLSGAWMSDKTGAELTMSAFKMYFGYLGFVLVVTCMILTAYDTLLAWCFYGESCCAYLFGHPARLIYRVLWLPFIMVGSLGKLEFVWNVADTLNGLMALPNLIALVLLSRVVFKLTREWKG